MRLVRHDLDIAQLTAFAELALGGIGRELPYKPGWILSSVASGRAPREVHPVFYGCFDWHSAVHSHWMLARCMAVAPGTELAERIRGRLDERFTRDALAREAAFFDSPDAAGFERPYGWAWLLRLAQEVRGLDDRSTVHWAEYLQPLERRVAALLRDYLPRLRFPVRSGMHTDTAFALGLALDHARASDDGKLATAIEDRARAYYTGDRAAPVHFEPSGEDFFSPSLNVADLMARVLPSETFGAWLDGFFPDLTDGGLGRLASPVEVSDPADGRLAHLAGLNLSRAWTLAGVAAALPGSDPRRDVVLRAHEAHRERGLDQVFSGHYEGDHWLASFAVYLETVCVPLL